MNIEPKNATPLEIPPGIYDDFTFQQYDRIKAFSRRDLDFTTPAHFLARTSSGDTDAMKFGRAVHCAILEPEAIRDRYLIIKKLSWSTKEGKAQREELDRHLADNPGLEWFDSQEFSLVVAMGSKFQKHQYAPKMIAHARKELVIVWEDEGSGLFCKCRIDAYDEELRAIAEYKTTLSAYAPDFAKQIFEHAYYRQAAFQMRGVRSHRFPVDNFFWIAQEKHGSFELAIYQATPEMLMAGEMENARALRAIARGLKSGKWPSYPSEPRPIEFRSFDKSRINDHTLEPIEEL